MLKRPSKELKRPSKELKALGIMDPLQNLTDGEIEKINKTRRTIAETKEKNDSEANFQAAVAHFNQKRNENNGSSASWVPNYTLELKCNV